MQHNKNTEFVMYVDNFLDKESLLSLQKTLTSLKYEPVLDAQERPYGMRHTFPKSFHNDVLLKLIKKFFFPYRDLEIVSISAHIRKNSKEPLFHRDNDKGCCANFLLFVIPNSSVNKSTFGFSKFPNVGKQVGGMIPLFVFQPIRFLLSNCS